MKNNILSFLLLICFSHSFNAQSFVVQYIYSKHIMKDSTAMISENTFLNIEKDHSIFFSEAPYLADSIIASDEKLGKKPNFKALPVDFLNCYIQKEISAKEVIYYSDEFDQNEYKYSEDPKLVWKISEQNKQLLGYKVYKASTTYAGRNYEAYFTTEIPVQDGPYKFFGLPGLILEIFDEKMDHHFVAVSISQDKKISIDKRISNKKYIETSKTKFVEMKKNYAEQPLKRMFELMDKTQVYEKKDTNGNVIDMKKVFSETQQRMIEEYKKENKIELSN